MHRVRALTSGEEPRGLRLTPHRAYGRQRMRTIEVTPSRGGVAVELPNDPRAAAAARRTVDALEGGAHPETLAKARLLITELVAASLGVPGAGPIQVWV